MQLFVLLFLLCHVAVVTGAAGCHSDRDKDYRPRENCTALGYSDVPAGLDPTTKVLLFPNNLFSSLSWSSFQTFKEIHEIDLTDNKVPSVTYSVSPVLPSLSVLRLSSNRLTALSDGAFSACPGLTELYLDNNAIGTLSNNTFSGLSKLEILDLASNRIKVLPALMLHPLPAIETLYLENNKITVMPDDWFSQKEEVPYLYLSANPWACSCSLGYLRRYLDDYELNVYVREGPIIRSDGESVVCDSPRWFKGRAVLSLEESDLCLPSTGAGPPGGLDQLVTSMTADQTPTAATTAAAGCHSDRDKDYRPRENCTALGYSDVPAGLDPTTKVLLFPKNLFSSLSWSSFQTFKEIHGIDLTDNKVPSVTSSVSPVLPSLSVLRLSSNRLTALSDGAFSACPGLTELYLDNNAISSLSNNTFSGLSKLEILDLASNRIKVLPALMLHPLPAIETLYLENNKITVMPDDWFSQKEEVPYLYLSANPWACSCSLGYLRRYLDDYELNVYVREGPIIRSDGESVVCDSPLWFKGRAVLTLEESDLCSPSTGAGPPGDLDQLVTSMTADQTPTAATTAAAGCHSDRDKDYRPRENCTALGYSDVPAGLEPTTKVLLFPKNLFSSLSWSSFQTFKEIHEIDLTDNKVPSVTSSVSPVLPSLSVLRLSSNRLTALSDGAFSACPGLTELYLDNNAIGTLSNNTFSGLSKLEILDLASNRIKVLPALMLHPLPAIETLYLENNKITVMPDDWFSQKEEVPYLYLSANPWACSCSLGYLRRYLDDYELNVYVWEGPIIKSDGESVVCDSPLWFKGTPVLTLEESDLCSPSTGAGPPGDLDQLVTSMTADQTPTAATTAAAGCHSDRDKDYRPRENCTALGYSDVPAGLDPTTKVLLFPKNLFSSLSWSSFQTFKEIHEIDLTDNKVPSVTSSVSPVLPSLSVLRLSSNRLTALSDGAFSACPGLTELYLDNNAIGTLSNNTFSGLSKLEILDLASNRIKVLPALMLHPLPAIEALYLVNNKITVMPDDWFSQKEEVPYLYLSANPWACSCSLGYLRRYLDDYELNVYVRDGPIIKSDGESVVCDSPLWFKGRAVLTLEETDLCSPSTGAGPPGDLDQLVTSMTADQTPTAATTVIYPDPVTSPPRPATDIMV